MHLRSPALPVPALVAAAGDEARILDEVEKISI